MAQCPDKEELTLKLVDDGVKKIGNYRLVVQDQQTYLVLTGIHLRTGYQYRFVLSQNSNAVFHSPDFDPKETSGEVFPTPCSNFVIAHNTGHPSSFHQYDTPQNKPKFKPLNLIQGAKIYIPTAQRFHEIALEYKQNNSGYDDCFPPQYLLKQETIKTLTGYLSESKKNLKMLVGYNHMHHLKTFGYTYKDLEGFDHHDAHDDTIVVLDDNQKMIYYIRVLIDQAPSIDDYYKEIARCDDFVKSLFMLHGERLTDHSIGVCSLLALPMVQLKDCDRSLLSVSENSKECCILFKEHLESKDSLKKELDQYLHRIHTIRKTSKLLADGNHFEKIIAESMATMSLQQAFLPRLTMDTQAQILSLFLNGEQYEAINHPNNKRIIRGPFGSGKSLVLEKIAEKLFGSMQDGIIYYICYDPYSLLDARMEEIFKEVTDKHQDPGNVKFVTSTVYQLLKDAGETEPINDLVKVMKHCLQDANGQQVHFLFDEVDTSYFNKENADSLKNFVDDETSLAMSTIILALQCTEKELIVHDGKGLTVELKNYCNDRINLTGLKLLRPLTKSMRMVKNLYKLKEVAEDKAGQESVVTALKKNETPRKPSTPDNTINKKTKAASQPKRSIQSTTLTTPPRNSTTSPKRMDPPSPSFNNIVAPEVVRTARVKPKLEPVQIKPVNEEEEQKKLISPEKEKIPTQPRPSPKKDPVVELDGKEEVNKINENNATMSSTMNLSPTKISVDQLAMYSTEPFTQDESKSMGGKFEHNFKFHHSKVGVSIPGKKASIVYLNKSFEMSSLEGAMVLQEILSSEILFQRDVKSTIICSNQEELDAVMFVIKKVFDEESYCQYTPLISKDIPTRKQKRDAWLKCNSPSHKILVTDFQSFRGCEAEHCVTFLKANDANYIPHILVEVFARAIAHLLVLVIPPPSTDNGNGRFQEVLKAWRDEELADVFGFNSKDTETGFELTLKSVSGADGSKVIDSKQINIERSSQEEFDVFKKRTNKDHAINECLRLFNENLAVHAPDILSLSLKKLTNDAMSLDQLDLVEQKHFGFLIGHGGAVIKSLKRDLDVDIEIEHVERSFKIRGSFEKKVNAVKVIKKKLDTEFWETLDIPFSLHRDILSQKYHWAQKFQVRVEKTKDRRKIQIQGEIGNVRKVLEEINEISNSSTGALKALDVPSCLSRYIYQNKQEFKPIYIDYTKKEESIKVIVTQFEKAQKIANDLIKRKRPDVSNMVETCLMTYSDRIPAHKNAWHAINDKLEYFEIKYQVLIRLDSKTRSIFVKGTKKHADDFSAFLADNLTRLMADAESKDYRKCYVIGLKADQYLWLEKSSFPGIRNMCTITGCDGFEAITSFYEIPDLKTDFEKALVLLQNMSSAYGELSLKFHLGKALFKLPEGSCQVIDIIKDGSEVLAYRRLEREKVPALDQFDNYHRWIKEDEFCRYDFTFHTYNPLSTFRYKIFVNLNGQFIPKEGSSQFVDDIDVGPGYFCWPEKSVARLDIVDPKTSLDLRLKVKMYESDPLFEQSIKEHSNALKNNFFHNLRIKPGTLDLEEIPQLPEGYILSYCRKSITKKYMISGTDIRLKISEESVLRNINSSDLTKDISDIYIENVKLTKDLNSSSWSPQKVANEFENVFDFGKDLLRQL
ncbi:uncharacterized protein [Clytia hemisphaerica]|uniref:K Homology domain-containing protein n=2 Tax=Clytia hemisphaerica TaxID=252671 RepID=A0A7M5V9C5_9CNID